MTGEQCTRLLGKLGVLSCLLLGCAEKAPDWTPLGGQIALENLEGQETPFSLFLELPESRDVVLRGTVGNVCPAGCWFYLEGEGQVTYVDVVGDFEMPESATGRQVWVVGKTDGTGGSRILQARRALLGPTAPEK